MLAGLRSKRLLNIPVEGLAKVAICDAIAEKRVRIRAYRDGCDGKAPMTPRGVYDATHNFVAFTALLGSATDFNIGIATGSASKIIVIDTDPRNGGTESLARLTSRLGPLTPDDFATVSRKASVLGEHDVRILTQWLETEAQAKPSAGQPIGF
jgi:hypothetical protein